MSDSRTAETSTVAVARRVPDAGARVRQSPEARSAALRWRSPVFGCGVAHSEAPAGLERGRGLREALSQVPKVDPDYVQFGSPDWFWEHWLNSYALQVEPYAHRDRDEATLDSDEALHIQGVRDLFFEKLRSLLAAEAAVHAAG